MEKRAFFNSIINDTATFIKTSEETLGKNKRTTKVFAKAGLDDVTSAMCYYQQWFGLTFINLALVVNFNFIFSIGICTVQTSNEIPAFANTPRCLLCSRHHNSSQ